MSDNNKNTSPTDNHSIAIVFEYSKRIKDLECEICNLRKVSDSFNILKIEYDKLKVEYDKSVEFGKRKVQERDELQAAFNCLWESRKELWIRHQHITYLCNIPYEGTTPADFE